MNRQKVLTALAATAVLGAVGGAAADRLLAKPPPGEGNNARASSNAAAEADEVKLSAERIRGAQIGLVAASSGTLASAIIAQALVASPPGAEAVLAARADGSVSRVVGRLGDRVVAGQALATIQSREASTIAAERATASARVTVARAAYAREKKLFDGGITARQDLEASRAELATAEAELRRASAAGAAAGVSTDGRSLAVTSPISGRITAAPAVLGSFITAGTELFRVADPGRIELRGAVPVDDARQIAPGDRATVRLSNGAVIAATVRAVTASVDPATRAATVVLVPVAGDTLRAGESLQVEIAPRGRTAGTAVSVPEAAVQLVGGRDVVFLRTATGFRVQPVTVAARGGGRIELSAGLRPGQVVAGQNAFLVKAELSKGSGDDGE
ncbi:MAG TPA: efflux RND transporter periplasmic adaptor subunit [Phenylobacterium sp.]